jgi:HPt (histidine-containing phosphotransfer) domain-containing protein
MITESKQEWIARLEEALGLDEEDIFEVAEMFFEELPEEMESIEKAYKAGDSASVARLAHGMKGSSANIGLDGISLVAKELEVAAKAELLPEIASYITRIEVAVEQYKSFLGISCSN